jgi:putative nucleotidyltransferase with HDIG domain
MRLEFINRVTEEDVLGKSILTNDGAILLRAGVKFTEAYIRKLKELGVFYVYIEDDRLEDIYIEDERLEDLKKSTIKNLSVIMKNINNYNKKDMKNSLVQVEELVEYIIESGDVNKSLYDVKTHDNYTYIHSIDTAIMATFLGVAMKFNEKQLKELGKSAILHDVGKLNINSAIINKNGTLSEEEFQEMRKHPTYGAEMLGKNIHFPKNIINAVLQHHERVDGRGYPNGLVGDEISKYAKIVSICDVYDAISNDRSYRKKFNPNDAYELILSGSGTAFDTDIVMKFRETFSVYPLGSCLKISDGVEGYVIRQNKNYPDRPVIRVLYDSQTRNPINFYEVDLLENINLVVVDVI